MGKKTRFTSYIEKKRMCQAMQLFGNIFDMRKVKENIKILIYLMHELDIFELQYLIPRVSIPPVYFDESKGMHKIRISLVFLASFHQIQKRNKFF